MIPVPEAYSGPLRNHDVTCSVMEVGAVRGSDEPEAIRNAVNGWYVDVVALGQARLSDPVKPYEN
jgi:hypothetical protein